MLFHQFYLGCLAHASYLIASGDEAIVVDPQRDVDEYIEFAQARGLKIRHVLETHLHADFVSGHAELARRTGATIYMGHRAGATFPHVAVQDGDELKVGDLLLRFLETPGHTPESISILVKDQGDADAPMKLLTGDTLFIGEVGRPDLVGSKGYTAEQMATMLYESLREKIMVLPRETMVYPAHGAGSLCGRKIADVPYSTLGEQLDTNYALQPMTREEFIATVTENLPEIPPYFPRAVEQNRSGAEQLGELPPMKAYSVDEAQALIDAGALVLDVRENHMFGNGHIPNSLSVPLGGSFAMWSGTFIAPGRQLIIVADGAEEAEQAQLRLARVGLQNEVGYLDGGILSWYGAGQSLQLLPHLSVQELGEKLRGVDVIDVRRPGEFEAAHIPGSRNFPLDHIEEHADELGDSRPKVLVCRSGHRSATAASLLQQHGVHNVFNLVGGVTAWEGARPSAVAAGL